MTTTMTPATRTAGGEPARPLSPARRVTLVLGTLLSAAVIAFTTVQFVGDLTEATEQVTFTVTPGSSTFAVRTQLGDVRVTRSADDRVHVTRTATFSLVRPTYAEGEDGGGAASGSLSATCPDEWPGACNVDYDVAVPAGMAVVLQSHHGQVRVADVAGSVDATSASGDIVIDGLSGPVRLRSETGEVTGRRLRSDDVVAASETGDVRLAFADAPTTVAVGSRHGDVEVLVPPGDAYRVAATTATGARTVTVDTSSSSSRAVTASTDSGDVQVLPLGALRPDPGLPELPRPQEPPPLPEPPR